MTTVAYQITHRLSFCCCTIITRMSIPLSDHRCSFQARHRGDKPTTQFNQLYFWFHMISTCTLQAIDTTIVCYMHQMRARNEETLKSSVIHTCRHSSSRGSGGPYLRIRLQKSDGIERRQQQPTNSISHNNKPNNTTNLNNKSTIHRQFQQQEEQNQDQQHQHRNKDKRKKTLAKTKASKQANT